jgi:hypothetical protein
MTIYEIYYENKDGEVIYCQDLYDEQEAAREIYALGCEFPDNSYWFEVTYGDEQ